MTTLSRAPIYVQLDRQREFVFNMNAVILLREAGADMKPMVERLPDTEDGKKQYRIDLEVLRVYAWASLQKDARARGEVLTLEQAGDLVEGADVAMVVYEAVDKALDRYYGREIGASGEALATEQSGKSRGRSKSGSASSAGK